ncbi:MAG: translation initiation factor IF-3 [Verrucomicrobiota bacterium]
MSRPFSPRSSSPASSFVRVNGKIRAREVRVIGTDGQQLGILSLGDALTMARQQGVDLVEIAASATPPVCRLVDYGKFRYEQAKRDKEAKKHQHANRVKEIQLSPTIDPHDFSVKLSHAIDFLCDDMKVKVTLRFRGREMAHQEFGFQVVQKLLKEASPYGHPDAAPKLIGRGINVMLSPLPRNKRARNPHQDQSNGAAPGSEPSREVSASPAPQSEKGRSVPVNAAESDSGFGHSPFADINLEVGQ